MNGGETIIIPDWYFNPGLTDDGVELVMEIMKKYDKFNVPLINPEEEWSNGLNPKMNMAKACRVLS